VIGAVSAVAGLTAARAWDLAPGGTIVLTTAFVFVVSAIVSSARAQQAARTEG
jgi:ABC-type Mn2+/Zn2+ transport system permease subunit